MTQVKCHQGLVHLSAKDHLGRQEVHTGLRCIGIVKEVNARYEICVKAGKARSGTYPLWLAAGIILTCHLIHFSKKEANLLE